MVLSPLYHQTVVLPNTEQNLETSQLIRPPFLEEQEFWQLKLNFREALNLVYERWFVCLFVLLEEVKRMIMVGQVLLESSLDHLFLLFPASCWPFHPDRRSPPPTHPNPCTALLRGAPLQSWHLHVYVTSFTRPSQTNLVIQSPLPLTPAYTLQSNCVSREHFLSVPHLSGPSHVSHIA